MSSQLWWMAYLALRSSFSSSDAPVCVSIGRAGSDTSLSCLNYGCMLVGGKAVHSPVTSPPCLLVFVSFFLQRPHLFFLLSFFSLLILALFFCPLKVSDSAETWGSKEENGSAPSHRGPFLLPLVLLPKLICARFFAFEASIFFCDRLGFDGPVNPINLHFNVAYKLLNHC